jgi:hypothetical protein
MIKQEVVKGKSRVQIIEDARPMIERYAKEGYELTQQEFFTGILKCKVIFTFNKK